MVPRKKSVIGQSGVITRNIVPVRKEPNEKSEQVTQALIGQNVSIEGGQNDWLFVQLWDTYRGWIQERDVKALEIGSHLYASQGAVAVIRELFADIFEQPAERSRIITKATIAVELEAEEFSSDWTLVLLPDGRSGYVRRQDVKLIDRNVAQTIWLPDPVKLVETAIKFVGVPYQWGGTTPFGLDCSGFVQLIYKIHNVTLLRDAKMQASDPRALPIDKSEIQAGDLIFFGRGSRGASSVSHVGMAVSNNEFIHSCGNHGVIITPLDDPDYTNIFWGARRMRLATLDPGGGVRED